jgi:uncharacterized protein (TIGR02594 family)
MTYIVQRMTALLDAPNGASIDVLMPNDILKERGQPAGGFIEVDTQRTQHGFVATADCTLVGAGERPPVDPGDFVTACLSAEADINALADTKPWFVSADYLIARAIIATDITNAGPKTGTDAVGPLQVGSAEWNLFLQSNSAVARRYRPPDFDHPLMQIYGAAYRMYHDAKAMSDLRPPVAGQDVFVPSYLDVYFAYLTDSPAAALAIRDAPAANQNTPIDQVLHASLTASQIASLLALPSKFFGTPGNPKTLTAVVTDVQAALNNALKVAFDDIGKYEPDAIASAKQGEAPWFDVALAEEAAHIAEPDPHILTYFQATDFRPLPTSTTVPWCGAFAAFCMSTSGNTTAAASVPAGAALAANWKDWGAELSPGSPDIPQGAVVVLSAGENTGGSGHVGFFVQFLDGDKVQLLGGNQSNRVQRTGFAKSRIAAIRWLDLQPATTAEQPGGASSNTAISPASINLIVGFEVTDQATYNRSYQKPTWPQGASGVTVGIGYDLGYTSQATLQADWGGKLSQAMIGSLQTAIGVTGSAAGALAKQLANVVVPWTTAMEVFASRDVPKWVGIVERALPNTDRLSPDCLGALVSLAFNRGASFGKQGDRYSEMQAIKDCMTTKNFSGIPPQVRNMKRLWPSMRGLQDRREQEARLFERGLPACRTN